MDEQNVEKKSDLASENDQGTKTERRRATENDSDPGVVRVKLPAAIGVRVKSLVAELKARGAQVNADELIAEYLEGIPERYFDEQLQRRTPEPYYLEAAVKVPELREVLIRYAKKGLLRTASDALPSGEPVRRRRKKGDADKVVGASSSNEEV